MPSTRVVFYDAEKFRPIPYRVRLHKPGEDRRWDQQGWWPVGLDWRPGAPTFLSNLVLTQLFRRLSAVFELHKERDPDSFQLKVVPLDDEGRELEDLKFFFVPTMPIDDTDREEFQRWQSAA
jgi:hypothetical protein